jgi:hypothetical protein
MFAKLAKWFMEWKLIKKLLGKSDGNSGAHSKL